MTISEVAAQAKKLGMTYGEYVRQFDPPGKQKKKHREAQRYCARPCAMCGADISDRGTAARFCLECARLRSNEAARKRHYAKKGEGKWI